jgi:hypothetical protein
MPGHQSQRGLSRLVIKSGLRVAVERPLAVSVTSGLLRNGGEHRANVVPAAEQQRTGLAGQRLGYFSRNLDCDGRHGAPRS